jgi:mono/diheme cytochrome c family protein
MRLISMIILAFIPFWSMAAESPTKFTAEQVAFYEKQVKPILAANCLKCHGEEPKKLRGGFNMLNRASVLKGGDTGPAVDAKEPAKSLLLEAITYKHKEESYHMPPSGKMADEKIAILTKWIEQGLPWSADGLLEQKTDRHADEGADKNYWAYQPLKREVPKVQNASWVKNPVDAFVLAKLEAKGLKPVAKASKAVLVRRAYYDLTGLPPTPAQVEKFVNDQSSNAWERLIDELLASPHYGEKWGRHWLDVVRYAETNGYERDGPKPYAWRYRDYVIRSFNADKPYDQFIKEQIAGDELPGASEKADYIIATGYYRLGLWDDEPADRQQALFDGYDDYVTVTGQAFLAMTLNCARCHEHKGDGFPQADYYRLLAFFRDVRHYSEDRNPRSRSNLSDITPIEKRKQYEAELQERQAKIEELTKRMIEIEDLAIKKLSAEDQRASEGPDRHLVVKKVPMQLNPDQKKEYSKVKRDIDDLKRKPVPSQEFALSVSNCEVNPPQTFIQIRGNAGANGKPVNPGFPEVFGLPEPKFAEPTKTAKTSGRRTVLANWLASKQNPLTARVMMNRTWMYHFGKGIVPTPNDFGKLGEKPTHPELLDWLASEFQDGGWTLKRIHKLLMTSNTYQMSSTATETNLKADPANNFYWRFNMRRLQAEEVRDSILTVSGSLNLDMFGPSVYPKIPKEVLAGQSVPGSGWPTSPPELSNRRSVYVGVKRSLQVPILITHDQADTDSSCPVRYTTTVPTQALGMLNSEFTNEQAAKFAERLRKEHPGDLAKQIELAIRLTTGRAPTTMEKKADLGFIKGLQEKNKSLDEPAAMMRYALMLLNTNEFIYLD